MAARVEMPMPGERRAPKFDGDSRMLLPFLGDYKKLCDDANVTEKDAIERIVQYLSAKPRALVERYDEFRTPVSWDDFRKRMIEDYLDAEAPSDYRRSDYEDFVSKAKDTPIRTLDKLGEFTRDFCALASDVKRTKAIHDEEVQRDYVDILAKWLGQELISRLIAEHKDKRRSEWTISETLKQAKIILKDAEAESKRRGGVTSTSLAAQTPAAAPQVAVKMEDPALAFMQKIADKISARIDQLEQRTMTPPVAGATLPPSGGAVPTAPPRSTKCFYCGGDCRIQNCANLATDTAAGLCSRNAQGRVVYPNGEEVRTTYGSWMRDKVAEYARARAGQAAQPTSSASAMLVELGESFFDDIKSARSTFVVPEFETNEAEEAWHEVMLEHAYAYEKKRAVNGQARRPGLRSGGPVQPASNEPGTKPDASATTSGTARDRPPHFESTVDRIPPVREVSNNGGAPASRGAAPGSAAAPLRRAVPAATIEQIPDSDAPAPRAPVVAPAVIPVVSPRPQFSLRAPLEDDGLTKIINERILESKVVLSVQEHLAISPALCHHWKDQSATRRVVVGYAGADGAPGEGEAADVFNFRQTEPGEASRDLIASEAALPLRYLDCHIGDYLVQGVVDNGSQLVIISQELWEALGNPIDAQHRVSPTAANKTSNLTLGLCILPVKIAGLTFHLRVHIVEQAPFSLLLGRPFLALARSSEDTRGDGSSFLTLHDDNTGRSAHVPTRARRTPRPESMPLDF